MITAITAILVAILSAIAELYLLDKIFTHPAGGWAGATASTLLTYKVVAVLPYLGVAAWAGLTRTRRTLHYSIIVGLIGIGLTYIALRQYSHATPFFLFVGYVGQWTALAVGRLTRRKA